MDGIAYEDLAVRLTPEAEALFREMVGAHLAAAGNPNRLFIRSDTNRGTLLIFTGGPPAQRDFADIDVAALDDLVGYSLLHANYSARGTPNYRVSGEGVAFHRWLMAREGEPLTQMDENVRRLVAGGEFAAAHAGAAHHLREAFDLLWEGHADAPQVVSEIGDHLRKAVMDMTNDVVGADAGGRQEQPIDRLKQWLSDLGALADRERVVIGALVDLTMAVLRLDHRLNHIRDEADKSQPAPTWEEVRRAAFTTAFVCAELDRASHRR